MKRLFERYAEWSYNVATNFILKYGEDPRPIRKLSGQIFGASVWIFLLECISRAFFLDFAAKYSPQIASYLIVITFIFSTLVFILYLGIHICVKIANHLDNQERKKDLDKDSDTL